MDIAKQLVLTLKQNNKSHVGYGLQKECESLVGHILQNMAKSQLPSLSPEIKNPEDSVRYREEGNQCFVMGDDTDAITKYTLSLAYANSKELMAYAHANRSAALYRKRMYRQCLIDIDAALSLGYPEEKKRKLRERGAKAVEEIKKSLDLSKNETIDSELIIKQLSISEELINGRTQDNLQKDKLDRDELSLKEIAKVNVNAKKDSFDDRADISTDPSTSKKPRYLEKEGVLKLANGPSKEAPAVSDGVEICFSEKYGRHLVATKEFQPGDIITMEDPYAHVIYEERFYTHCHHCLSRSYNLIPCPECPIAQYCSDKCRTIAWKTAHQIECPVLAMLVNLPNIDRDKIRILMKIIRLLIVVTSKGQKIQALREDMEVAEINPDSRTAGFTDEGILDSFSGRSALSLATNMTTRPLIGISAFACISALAAIFLSTETKFFGKKYEVDELHDISQIAELKFCGSIMFRACVIMSSNCFSVQQEPGIKSGSGLYIAHSLYNHSCAANTFRHFEGLTMITRALGPIFPGEQVFTTYGAGYAYMPKAERRQKIMQDYFFNCECPACLADWPTYNEILKNHVGSVTKNKSLVEKLKPFKQRLLTDKYDIDAVKNVLNILYKTVKQPCEEIVHGEQYLKSYYLDP